MAKILKVKNTSGIVKTWVSKDYAINEEYEVPANLHIKYSQSSDLLIDVGNGDAQIGNSSQYFTSVANQLNWLFSDYAEVTPRAPKNEFSLKPYGACHKHIDSSSYIFSITLTNKDQDTFNYSCTTDPEYHDCISNTTSEIKDGVYTVDTQNNSVTLMSNSLANGTYNLNKPIDIDYHLPAGEDMILYLWGAYVSVKDYGEDDLVRLQIIDKDGIGVALGWYTQQEFEAMGSLYVIKEYDECWVNQLDKLNKLPTPDGAPGELIAGLYLRAKYYPKDATKTDIKVWIDYIVTIKD